MQEVGRHDTQATDCSAVILVEGVSDRVAVEALALRLGRNLDAEGIAVVPMGGAHAIGRFLTRFGPYGAKMRLAGLYDLGEESVVGRALQRAGLSGGQPLTRDDMESLGFFVCVVDLENELIRALGAVAVVNIIASQGELESFRTLQKEPAWRGRQLDDQIRRFLGNASRKIRYARLIIEALELAEIPRPLRLVLAHL